MIELANGEGTRAVINPEGAFVESLELADGTPLLFARRSMPVSGKNRGGIPVCAPIFGPGESVGLNQHGFARNLHWEIAEQTESQVKLTLDNPASQMKELPASYYGCAMELTIELKGDEGQKQLRETLTIRNVGTETFIVNPAFHPYFPVSTEESAEQYTVLIDDRQYQFASDELAATRKIDSIQSQASLNTPSGTWQILADTLPLFAVWTDSSSEYICVEPTESGYISDNPADELAPCQEKTVGMTLQFIEAAY